MSILSDKLKYYLTKRGLTVGVLAKRCGIDRSSMLQYLNGRRHLQNTVHLEKIIRELRLMPSEKSEILEAFEINRIGMERYAKRRKIKEILSSLLTIDEKMELRVDNGTYPHFDTADKVDFVQGEYMVNHVLKKMMYDAVALGGDIFLLSQPDYDFLMELLMLANDSKHKIKVTQIICLENGCNSDGCSGLENIRKILHYGVGVLKFEPRYFYGKEEEFYGVMSLFPRLILTERYALCVSADRKTAFLYNSEQELSYFHAKFVHMIRESFPLMESIENISDNHFSFRKEFVEKADFSDAYEMCSGLCSVQFWDKQLIMKYINKALPNHQQIVEEYAEYVKILYQAKKRGKITVLMNMFSVEEFIKSGVFREYPEVFFSEPLSKDDRRILINRVLNACEEGWYHPRMVPSEMHELGFRWEIIVHGNSHLTLQYSYKDHIRNFDFREPDVVDAMHDYLSSLADKEGVLSSKDSCALLEKWMEMYLK